MKRSYLYLAAAVCLITAWQAVGFHQADEHWQILEFANYKLGRVSAAELPWEFGEQMRPAFQPFIAYSVHRFLGLFGEANPHWVTFVLRLLSVGLYFLVGWLTFRRFAPVLDRSLVKWLALAVFFHWANLYSGVRFSGENWSGLLAMLGLLVYPLSPPERTEYLLTPARRGGAWWCLLAGWLFGLAFLARYQVALGVLGFGAWLVFVGREHRGRVALTILGGVAALALGTVLDHWLYGEWVNAPWNYLRINVFEGVAATYGSLPWWDYLRLIFLRGIPPVSLLYILAAGWFAYRYRRDPLAWFFALFFVAHCVLSRKDIRFLFPLLPLLPVALVAGAQALQRRFGTEVWARTQVQWGVKLCLVVNAILLVSVMFRPVASEMLPANFVYTTYETPPVIYADRRLVYDFGELTLHYYMRPGTQLIEARPGPDACPPTTPCLYSAQTHDVHPPDNARLVWTDRPAWLRALNFGGWQDGLKWWYIYELE